MWRPPTALPFRKVGMHVLALVRCPLIAEFQSLWRWEKASPSWRAGVDCIGQHGCGAPIPCCKTVACTGRSAPDTSLCLRPRCGNSAWNWTGVSVPQTSALNLLCNAPAISSFAPLPVSCRMRHTCLHHGLEGYLTGSAGCQQPACCLFTNTCSNPRQTGMMCICSGLNERPCTPH